MSDSTPQSGPITHSPSQNVEAKALYIPTEAAYAQWASVYDTDNNFLQAIDDAELEDMLPGFLQRGKIVPAEPRQEDSSSTPGQNTLVIDLGCGTGRNTFKLLRLTDPTTTTIIGLDSSNGMLSVAQNKVRDKQGPAAPLFKLFDINQPDRDYDLEPEIPSEAAVTRPPAPTFQAHKLTSANTADAIVSTLVLEHVQLTQFFTVASRMLRRGGCLLVTNMHSDMGRISRAGFVNAAGVKVRPETSIPHTVEEVCEAAGRLGFVVQGVKERAVGEGDVQGLGARSGKWVGIRCWFAVELRLA